MIWLASKVVEFGLSHSLSIWLSLTDSTLNIDTAHFIEYKIMIFENKTGMFISTNSVGLLHVECNLFMTKLFVKLAQYYA